MIAFQEAKRLVAANMTTLPVEWTPLLAAQGRIVSSRVPASLPLPPFDHAAMDGFALRAADAAPGRALPMLFATAQGKPIFALPGNPASTMVTFELFVRPALRRMLGHGSQERPRVMARMTDAWRKEPGKLAVLRARVTKEEPSGYHARLTGPQGPMSFQTTAAANALVLVPAASEGFRPGELVETMLLEPAEVCGMACLPIGGDAGISLRP